MKVWWIHWIGDFLFFDSISFFFCILEILFKKKKTKDEFVIV